jgi:nitrogen fixation NifU-like protein
MAGIAEPLFEDLARESIIDHYRQPRNRGTLPHPALHFEGLNPVCGDEILLDLHVASGRLADIAFAGQGCSISQASASMMTELVKGGTLEEADALHQRFRAMMVDGAEPSRELGDLEALHGVAKFPVRVKCALLCWNVLHEGLEEAKKHEFQSTRQLSGEDTNG